LSSVPGGTSKTYKGSTGMGTGTHGNSQKLNIPDQLAREGSSHPLKGPEPALGISAKVAR